MPTNPRGNYIFSYIKDVSYSVKVDSNNDCHSMVTSYIAQSKMGVDLTSPQQEEEQQQEQV